MCILLLLIKELIFFVCHSDYELNNLTNTNRWIFITNSNIRFQMCYFSLWLFRSWSMPRVCSTKLCGKCHLWSRQVIERSKKLHRNNPPFPGRKFTQQFQVCQMSTIMLVSRMPHRNAMPVVRNHGTYITLLS